ncbi:hypothetical protein [Pararhodobacter aggregans]
MSDRIELDGGIISAGPEAGRPLYFVSARLDGADWVLWHTPIHARAVIEARRYGADWGLPVHDRTTGEAIEASPCCT